MRLSANVRAWRFAWCLKELMGTSDRLLSSSQRWRSCWRPSKLSSGTLVIWFASRRLQDRSKRKKVWLQRPFYTGQMSKAQLHSGCFHFNSDQLNGPECTKSNKNETNHSIITHSLHKTWTTAQGILLFKHPTLLQDRYVIKSPIFLNHILLVWAFSVLPNYKFAA